jgi:lipopolysaccharide transport system ATP-binding protein
MQVRLAFAVAAHLEPELLIIDEVLAVGDAEFQSKCLGKMRDVATGGRTVLFVSHNMAAVESLCSRGVMVANGRITADGDTSDAIAAYMRSFRRTEDSREGFSLLDHPNRRSGSETIATRLTLTDAEGRSRAEFSCTEEVTFHIDFAAVGQKRLIFAIFVCSRGQRLFMFHTQVHSRLVLRDTSTGRVSCTAPTLPLIPNSYDIEIVVANGDRIVDHVDSAGTITISHGDSLGTGALPAPSQGYFIVQGSWEYQPAVDENRRDTST